MGFSIVPTHHLVSSASPLELLLVGGCVPTAHPRTTVVVSRVAAHLLWLPQTQKLKGRMQPPVLSASSKGDCILCRGPAARTDPLGHQLAQLPCSPACQLGSIFWGSRGFPPTQHAASVRDTSQKFEPWRIGSMDSHGSLRWAQL